MVSSGRNALSHAIEFGLDIPYAGFNVFATGPGGAGKTSIITHFLEDKAASRPVPPDWGYAHNFAAPDSPIALRLPPGGGSRLRGQVNALLAQVADALEKMFAGEQYTQSRNALGAAIGSTAVGRVSQPRNERARTGLCAHAQG